MAVLGSYELISFRFWKDVEVKAYDCGDEPADWFCYYLNKPLGTYRLILNSRSRNSSKHKVRQLGFVSDSLLSQTRYTTDSERYRKMSVLFTPCVGSWMHRASYETTNVHTNTKVVG